jgi:16S rRNA (adenine1518-N6/adenine1519-N6)-dimethyltransferase
MKSPVPERDQHFMVDAVTLDLMSDFAKGKVVLEIGGGSGNLTKSLVKKAKRVFVIENDSRFEDELRKTGAEVFIADALEIEWPEADVLVSNLPYSICEPIVTRLLRQDYKSIVATFPMGLYQKFGKTKTGIFYSEMFDVELLKEVPRKAFDPSPREKSVLLKLVRKPSETLISKVIEQYDKKLKNALREAFCGFNMNKRDSKLAIKALGFPEKLLEKRVVDLENRDMQRLVKIGKKSQ